MAKRELTESERRETLTETLASLALEGMYPSEQDLTYARGYIAGEMTLEQIREQALGKYRER